MAENSVALPHFWPILDAMPAPLLYKEHSRSRILANQAALTLLQRDPTLAELSLADIQQLPLYNPDNHSPYDLLHNPLLLALSGTALQLPVILGNNPGQPLLLHSKLVTLSFTLHSSVLISLQPMQGQKFISDSTGALAAEKSGSATDISELEEALAFDKLISLISTELINVQHDKLDQHILDALAAVGEFCHADRSYVFQFNADISEMSNTHEWVRPGVSSHKDQLQQIPQEGLPYFYQKIRQDLVFAVNKVSELPLAAQAEKQEFDAEDIQSVLCCAMHADNKLLGFVGCDMVARQRDWTSNDLRRMKLVGEMIAKTLQNVRYRQSLQQIQQQLLQANQELQKQASQDGLTGIANRRQFDHHLQSELKRSARNQQPLGLLMLDIDRFKHYNDHYGHQAGDEVLQQVAQLLQQQVKRQGELAARYGGEEFAIILPGSNSEACHKVASNIQQQLTQLGIAHQNSDIQPVLTVSMGYCSIFANQSSSTEMLIKQADAAQYQAKKSGRNQVCSAS
ncbi:sensor domain-containing diguanylate cyclase [Rheinheimera pleomorphica]|uniref:sensor domain-containing diguanylate cyclase n=1 Tax=Rheinheimera pleomorphica TaxID=2703963 RepID=UPI001420E74E|nr:sensor domain-containing diguanylate cyclase [Rheinheimera pleomorphica]